ALNSTSTLWHLLQLSFPELKVEVHKFPRVLKVLSSSTILGATCIGRNSLLGKSQKLTISSFKIILTAENMDIPMNTPWPIEVKRRLKDLIFPKIHRMNIYTQIILVVKNCQDVAHLATTSRLGFRSLGKSQELIRLLLFAGYPHEGTG
nr:hypothetical protein [Rhabdochlamydiaceae bacterium]